MINADLSYSEPAKKQLSFDELSEKIKQFPNDFNVRFKYALEATKLGKVKEAEESYVYMLSKKPGLSRVKLELAMLYTRTARFKKAKKIFEEVLAINPPENVKKNIEKVMLTVNKALKKNVFSLATSFGLNYDSNATSASSSGETTFADISIPLADNSQAQNDGHLFGLASVGHKYRFDIESEDYGVTWDSNLTGYRSQYGNQRQLDISLLAFKTGPVWDLKKWRSQVGLSVGNNLIVLNSFKYLKTRNLEIMLKHAPRNDLIFDAKTTFEYRKFANAPESTTNTDRSGHAYQEKLSATYIYSKNDIFTSSITWRNEAAQAAKYGMDQINLTAGYIRQLPYNMALNTIIGFKKTHYDALDTSISTEFVRSDRERSITLTLTKKLPKNVTLTGGYQYKNVTSNIQNYDYYNNRIIGAVGWSF